MAFSTLRNSPSNHHHHQRSSPPQPPTSTLPALGRLNACTGAEVHAALGNLRALYFPRTRTMMMVSTVAQAGGCGPVLPALSAGVSTPLSLESPSRRRGQKHKQVLKAQGGTGYATPVVVDSGYASAEEDDDGGEVEEDGNQACCELLCLTDLETECSTLEVLRADPFERTFALRWVTGFVSRAEEWAGHGGDDADEVEGELRAALLEEALDILAAFTSCQFDEPAGKEGEDDGGATDRENDGDGGDDDDDDDSYTRMLTFEPKGVDDYDGAEEGKLTVEINDAPINGEDHTSVGLVTWGSSIIFGERLCLDPARYLPVLSTTSLSSQRSLRVLELGAGTGILSIVAAKLLKGQTVQPQVVATDYHPDVLANLRRNVAANFSPPSFATTTNNSDATASPGSPVQVEALDWERPVYTAPFDERFDVILAADVVYHPEHARWIKSCVEQLLVLPSPSSSVGGVFWLFIAVRPTGRHEGLDQTVDELFGQPGDGGGGAAAPGQLGGGPQWKLGILEAEKVGRVGSRIGRVDEAAYRLFKIGWIPVV